MRTRRAPAVLACAALALAACTSDDASEPAADGTATEATTRFR